MDNRLTAYWNLYAELRKEIIESQKLRAQVIGFKITFVSAAIGLLTSHLDKIENSLLVVPAFASIFFDFLINSYSFSIRRIGFYLKDYLESNIKTESGLSDDFISWQSYSKHQKPGAIFAFIGNFGITFLASATGIAALFFPFKAYLSPLLITY